MHQVVEAAFGGSLLVQTNLEFSNSVYLRPRGKVVSYEKGILRQRGIERFLITISP